MSILQEFAEKYNGSYHEEPLSVSYEVDGKYTYQPKKGEITFKGSRISFSINEVGGADPIGELFRMRLHLNKQVEQELLIIPRTGISRFISRWIPNLKFPKSFHRKYKITGDKELIIAVSDNQNILNMLQEFSVCLHIREEEPEVILATPLFGYRSIDQLESICTMLKELEAVVSKS